MRKNTLFSTLCLMGGLLLTPTVYAGKGMLKIVTDPGEAKIYINGKRKGSTPAEKGQTFAVKLAEGEYTIKAVKETSLGRWVGEKSDIFVGEDTLQTVSINLKLSLTDANGNKIQVPVVTSPSELRQITDRYRSDSNRKKDFIPLGNGTVLDKRTGLQWMRCSVGQSWTGTTCSGEPDEYNWKQANALRSNFAEHSDWRLPTRFELETLVYCSSGKDKGRDGETGQFYLDSCAGKYQRPTIVQTAFPNTKENTFYWSASPGPYGAADDFLDNVWSVYFLGGGSFYGSGRLGQRVRLVRFGQ